MIGQGSFGAVFVTKYGATVDDLMGVDMWAYEMLLYNLLNPCLRHPYEEVLKQEETGNTKDKIVHFLHDGRRLNPCEKYAKRCQLEWCNVWNLYEACACFHPRDRPDTRKALQLLRSSWETER